MAVGQSARLSEGDVVRFAEGEVHELIKEFGAEFECVVVTAPHLEFTPRHRRRS